MQSRDLSNLLRFSYALTMHLSFNILNLYSFFAYYILNTIAIYAFYLFFSRIKYRLIADSLYLLISLSFSRMRYRIICYILRRVICLLICLFFSRAV